jgi:hypothetical protein
VKSDAFNGAPMQPKGFRGEKFGGSSRPNHTFPPWPKPSDWLSFKGKKFSGTDKSPEVD